MATRRATLRQDGWKILDELVFGGVLALLGWYGSMQLESHRTSQAVRAEVAKARSAAVVRTGTARGAFEGNAR
jgi:hypothetical protein